MTYEEWAATVKRGVTITPQMAFTAGAASVKPEVALVEAYRCGEDSRDAEVAELVSAIEDYLEWLQCDHDGQAKSRNNAKEALAKVRKP